MLFTSHEDLPRQTHIPPHPTYNIVGCQAILSVAPIIAMISDAYQSISIHTQPCKEFPKNDIIQAMIMEESECCPSVGSDILGST